MDHLVINENANMSVFHFSNLDECWSFTTTTSSDTISIIFEQFSTEHYYDFVTIYDGKY